MPRDTVAERKHAKNLRRNAVRDYKLRRNKKGELGTWKSDRLSLNDPFPPRESQPARGPKKFKFKRDVKDRLKT